MSFDSLGLSQPILKAVQEKGYNKASSIQEKVIPLILDKRDVLASAQTGTGKTAGFILPILQHLDSNSANKHKSVKALVLTPTRELAAQIMDNAVIYGQNVDVKSAVIFGGVKQNSQVNALRNGVDLLIATPGRLLDLHKQRHLALDRVEILVLDEADRMLDMGFLREIKRILDLIPAKRQNLLFSATYSRQIKKLAGSFMHDQVFVEATPESTTVEKIVQKGYYVSRKQKTDFVIDLIAGGQWQQVLVFTRTKHGANRLCEKMVKADVSAVAIHGNKTQAARTKALASFKAGKVRVLVATDIAARGLDIPLLPHVINFELPNVPEDYVHRIGRTGRAGASGEAISLVSKDELEYLSAIEHLIKLDIPIDSIALEIDQNRPTPEVPEVEERKSNQDRNRQQKNRRPKTKSSPNQKSYRRSKNKSQKEKDSKPGVRGAKSFNQFDSKNKASKGYKTTSQGRKKDQTRDSESDIKPSGYHHTSKFRRGKISNSNSNSKSKSESNPNSKSGSNSNSESKSKPRSKSRFKPKVEDKAGFTPRKGRNKNFWRSRKSRN